MSKWKTAVAYLTGWHGAKVTARELRSTAILPFFVLRGIGGWLKAIKDAAAEDRRLAEVDSDVLWDQMVVQYGITTESVKRKYRIAEWVNALLCIGIAVSIAFTAANYDRGAQLVIANGFFVNIILMLLFQNAYRLNMAYTQSAPPVLMFLKDLLRRPILLIARPLPENYQVGVRAKQ